MSLKSRVEAVLFLTDKPVLAAVVAKLVNEDVQLVRQALLELIHDYEERNGALEIADDDEGYMMQVKDPYANLANNLAPIDLPVSIVRTLSAIAIKQPVLQSEIVRIRGAGAYDHIKELLEKELITKKEEGRSSLLSTTKKFQEYFRLSQDAKALRYQLREEGKDKPADGSEAPADQQLHLPLEAEAALAALVNEGDPENGQVLPVLPGEEQVENGQIAAQMNEEQPENDQAIAAQTPEEDGQALAELIAAQPIEVQWADTEEIAAKTEEAMPEQTQFGVEQEFVVPEITESKTTKSRATKSKVTKSKTTKNKELELANESLSESEIETTARRAEPMQIDESGDNNIVAHNAQPGIKSNLTQMQVIN